MTVCLIENLYAEYDVKYTKSSKIVTFLGREVVIFGLFPEPFSKFNGRGEVFTVI